MLISGRHAFCPASLVKLDETKERACEEAMPFEGVFGSSVAAFAFLLPHVVSGAVILLLLELVLLVMKKRSVERKHVLMMLELCAEMMLELYVEMMVHVETQKVIHAMAQETLRRVKEIKE